MKRFAGSFLCVLFFAAPAQAQSLGWHEAKRAITSYAQPTDHIGAATIVRCDRISRITVDCLVEYTGVTGPVEDENGNVALGDFTDRQRAGLRNGHLWVFSRVTVPQKMR